MSDSQRPLLADLKEELGSLGGELRELAVLRWQLAVLELQADARELRRLAVALVAAVVLAIAAVPVFCVVAADALDGWLLGRAAWLAVIGGGLVLAALLAATFAWLRFRRRFSALRQTREELAEDAVWLREWLQKRRASGQVAAEK
jgi:uncharacterized membrane protein YqjE